MGRGCSRSGSMPLACGTWARAGSSMCCGTMVPWSTPASSPLTAGAWSPAAGTGPCASWDAETGSPRWRLENRSGVNALAYSPSRDLLVIGGNGRRIELVSPVFRGCDATQRQRLEVLLARLDDDSYAVREAASREILGMGLMAEPWLGRLMTESQSAEVRLRCRHLRQQLFTTPQAELSGHGDEVESVAVALDGNLLASVDRAGTVRLWNIVTRGREGISCLPIPPDISTTIPRAVRAKVIPADDGDQCPRRRRLIEDEMDIPRRSGPSKPPGALAWPAFQLNQGPIGNFSPVSLSVDGDPRERCFRP